VFFHEIETLSNNFFFGDFMNFRNVVKRKSFESVINFIKFVFVPVNLFSVAFESAGLNIMFEFYLSEFVSNFS